MSALHCPFSTWTRERPLFISREARGKRRAHRLCAPAAGGPTPPGEGHQPFHLRSPRVSGLSQLRAGTRGPRLHRTPRLCAARDAITTRPLIPASRPRPTALRFDVVTARLTPFGHSSSARGPSSGPTAGTRVLFVACLFRHVPGRLLSADSGTRNSKGSAGRTRAGLHAPGDKQEGSVPGVCSQLPDALLAGRPA